MLLDCRNAQIHSADRRFGILITAPAGKAVTNVTVRNCRVEGFLNNLRVTRRGFRRLAAGREYEHAFSNILIEDSAFLNSRGAGIFIDGYVTGVTLRRLHVEGSGSAGIYLEAGSKDNVIEHSRIVNNGYRQNGPRGQFHKVAGLNFWFWGTGREGLAVDGSRGNRIVNNYFTGNSAGAIFLYKNCGEYADRRPDTWFARRYGADGNLIEGNRIEREKNGVWIASRMGENTLFMDCSDPAYLPGFVLDRARGNTVRANDFRDVNYGVRVEDDGNIIADNRFFGGDPAQQAVLIGTRWRTLALRRPVDATAVTGNHAQITGNPHPYRWIHGHTNTRYERNQSLGQTAGFCEGRRPPGNLFLFVVDFALADPADPPDGEPPLIPPPDPLPPCQG